MFAAVENVRDFAVAYVIPPLLVYHVVDSINVLLFNKDLRSGQRFEEFLRCQQTVVIGVVRLERVHQRKFTTCLFELVAHTRQNFREFKCLFFADFKLLFVFDRLLGLLEFFDTRFFLFEALGFLLAHFFGLSLGFGGNFKMVRLNELTSCVF